MHIWDLLSILILVAIGKDVISKNRTSNQKGGESNQMPKKISGLGKCVSQRDIF